MNSNLILLMKKHTDALIKQLKSKPQETLEFKLNKQMQFFSFSPTINSVEERKWLLAITFCESINSVFNITNEDNSFPITTPGHWNSKSAKKNY